MARVTSNSLVAAPSSVGASIYTNLYVEYTVTDTDSTSTIAGDIYLYAHQNTSSPYHGVSGRATNVSVTIDGTLVAAGKSGYVEINSGQGSTIAKSLSLGSFTKTINKMAAESQGITLSFSGQVILDSEYLSSSKSGTLSGSTTINVSPLTEYTISYNINGGSGTTPSSQTKYYGINLGLSQSTGFSRSGYTFYYWNTKQDGGGTNYSAGGTYATNASATLYALWHQNPSLSYVVNSTGTYYKNASAKPYRVTISNIITSDSKSVRNIVLTLGSQTASRTNAGSLEIVPSATGTNIIPTIVITDTLGASTQYDLTPITVKENTAPSGHATVISSGYYYAGVSSKPYQVNVDQADPTNGKSISSIVLTVGTETKSRTSTGILSVTPMAAGNNIPVTVVITDNMGVSYTALSTSIVVYTNDLPTLSYSVTSSSPYYVGSSVTPYKVTISNFSNINHKTISSVKLTFGNQTQTLTQPGTFSIVPAATGSITPTILVTDNIGQTNSVTLPSVSITANDPPTCTVALVPVSGNNYYVGVSSRKYQVTVADVSPKNGKTITSIVLTLGSQTASRTNAGTLEITPSTAGTFTPTVKITDSAGNSTTYNLNPSTVTVYENTEPSATVQATSATVFYAGAPTTGTSATPYTVSITNLQAYNNKTIVSAVLTIGSATKTLTTAGSLTIYPSTAGTFTPTVVVTDNIGKTKTYSLTPITVNQLVTQINRFSTQRIAASSGSAGALDDEGANAVLQVKINYSNYQGANGKNFLLQPVVAINNTQTSLVTWYTGWTSSGGFTGQVNWSSYQPSDGITLYAKVTYTFDRDTSYIISVTPKSTAKTGSAISATLAQAFYLLAGKAGGHALGIGKKPTIDGVLDVGMQSIILNNYNGNSPSIDYQGARAKYAMIKFKDNTADAYGNGIVIGGGGLVVIGAGESADAVANTRSGADEALDLASDGTIKFWTNVQNGAASAHTETIDASGIYSGRAANIYVPRAGNEASINLNNVPSQYFGKTAEYGPNCTNLPSAHWYFITTWRGADNNYCAQLAVGETTNAAYYRVEQNTSWGSWTSITNTNTWRGIQDNLTSSTNTTESLSAKQGYLLANGSARDSTKLPLAGGTMTGQIQKASVGVSWYQGRSYAIIRNTATTYTDNKYNPILSVKSINGTWDIGTYTTNNSLYFTYITDTNFNSSTNTTTQQMYLSGANGYLYATGFSGTFSGNGASITSLNASNLGSGTVPIARIPTGTASTQVALGNHTHGLSMATSSGTNAITLAASTKYQLTAGGSTYIFTTPPNTTYSSQAAASGGTTVSLCTTGEKYTWNTASTKVSGIGTKVNSSLTTARSLPTGTTQRDECALCSVTLSAGTWLLLGRVSFPANSSGRRVVNIAQTKGSNWAQVSTTSNANNVTNMQVFNTVVVSSGNPVFWLNVNQTSGSALTMPANEQTLEAYRIA